MAHPSRFRTSFNGPEEKTKLCSKCKQDLPLSNFSKDKYQSSGLEPRCKLCKKIHKIKFSYSRDEAMIVKKCIRCEVEKSTSKFYSDKTVKCGLQGICISCVSKAAKIWSKKNRIKKCEQTRQYRYRNPEKRRLQEKKWRKANPDKVKAMVKRYYEKNYGKIRAYFRKRYAQKLQAIPRWANLRRIESVYKAVSLKPGFVVDHIIPLQGKTVCGLHVENNLRIILKLENQQKHHKLLPEFFDY